MDVDGLHVEILHVDYLDKYEGKVKFKTESGNEYEAYYWGNTFKSGEKRQVKISHLGLRFDWDATFSLNSSKEKRLEKREYNLGYIGYGQIEQVNPVIACFGDIKLNLGNWTNDERVINEYICWQINRLEIK